MKRTRGNSDRIADAILTADLHLTDKTPTARTDDYIEAQKSKLWFLSDLSRKNNNCPIICSGDIFDSWRASPWLCGFAYSNIPGPFITIPGNHDLPMHNLLYYDKSGLSLIEEVRGDIIVLKNSGIDFKGLQIIGVPAGELESFDPNNVEIISDGVPVQRRVLLLHELIWEERGWLEARIGGETGKELLDRLGALFDLIVSGDNHQSFIYNIEAGRSLLVNPGSMMRIHADQEDFKPKCYLYYASDNSTKEVRFPIQRGVISTEHIEKRKERDERISAYIERMNQHWEIGLSFRNNLESFFNENQTPKKVRDVIWAHLETEKS